MLWVKVAFLIFPLIYKTEPSIKQESFPGMTFVLLTAEMQPSGVGHTMRITWTAAFNRAPGHRAPIIVSKIGYSPKGINFPWKQPSNHQKQTHSMALVTHGQKV